MSTTQPLPADWFRPATLPAPVSVLRPLPDSSVTQPLPVFDRQAAFDALRNWR